jgi:hypothetical protein
MSAFLVDCLPTALARGNRAPSPLTVILSDGDVVFQPAESSAFRLWEAVEGRILSTKEQMLDDVRQRYPARHYVMIDDKLRILA